MVKVEVKEYEHVYHLHGGGYDGSTFKCGPGLPTDPPPFISIEDEKFIWRYGHAMSLRDEDEAPGGYKLVSETRK